MTTLAPYLNFDGNCEEAINFYADCLGGTITAINRYSEMPDAGPVNKEKIMHCELTAGNIHIMACDAMMPGYSRTVGNHITLSINLTDQNQQTEIFNKLANGGQITMPLENTFWGARFGMVVDKYGFSWMLNCGQEMAAQ